MHRIFLPALSLALLSGCSIFNSSDNSDLDDARERWTSAAISDYIYSLTVSCFCSETGTFEVEVRNGVVVGVTPSASVGKTVDELFGVVAQAYAQNADTVTVSYDAELGYPTSITIDYVSDGVSDDEIFYGAENLEPLN